MPKKPARHHAKRKQSGRGPKQLRLLARGETTNRDTFIAILILLLASTGIAAGYGAVKSGAVPAIFDSGNKPQPAKPDTVTLTLGQSKGINWYPLEKWKTEEDYNWAGVKSDVADMQNAGISWIRFTLTTNNEVNDKLVEAVSEHNMRILAIIPPDPEKKRGNFFQRLFYRDYVKKLVSRYIEKIQYFEVGNEPNSPNHWEIDTSQNSDNTAYEKAVSEYVLHLKETATAIKAGNINAQVFLGGLSDEGVERWVDVFISKNGYTYVDGVSFHVRAATPAELGKKIHDFKVALAKVPDFAVKPLWITDFGFTTDTKDTSVAKVPDEKTKADYVLEGFSSIRNEGLHGPVFWTKLSEKENDKPGFGLVMKNTKNLKTTYLPAYEMLKSF